MMVIVHSPLSFFLHRLCRDDFVSLQGLGEGRPALRFFAHFARTYAERHVCGHMARYGLCKEGDAQNFRTCNEPGMDWSQTIWQREGMQWAASQVYALKAVDKKRVLAGLPCHAAVLLGMLRYLWYICNQM